MNNCKVYIWGKFWPDGIGFTCIDYTFQVKDDQTYLVFEGNSLEGNREIRYFKLEDVGGYSIEYLT